VRRNQEEGEISGERICEEKPGRRGNKWRDALDKG